MNHFRLPRCWPWAAWGIFGCLVFSFQLTTLSLWHDEGFSVLLASMPLDLLFEALHSYNISPPLWYLTCRAFLEGFNQAPWAVRLPSLLATVGSLVLMGVWLAQRVSKSAAHLASALFIFSPMANFYAHEGRYYALLGFLFLGALAAADLFFHEGRKRYAVLSAFAALGMLYLHNYGAVFYAVLHVWALGFLLAKKDRKRLSVWVGVHAVVVLAYLPWAMSFVEQLGLAKEKRFLLLAWREQNPFLIVFSSLRNLVPGDGSRQSFLAIPHVSHLLFFPSAMVVAVMVLLVVERRLSEQFAWKWIAPVLLPLIFISTYSWFYAPAYIVGRTEGALAPFFCAALGVLISKIKMRIFKIIATTFLLGGGCAALVHYHAAADYPRKRWDLAALQRLAVGNQEKPYDLIVLDAAVTASIPAQIEWVMPGIPKMIFPDTGADPTHHWRNRFLPINATPEKHREQSEVAFAQFKIITESRPVNRLGFVFYSLGKKQDEWVYSPVIVRFRSQIENLGFKPCASPETGFPMDWISGYHVIGCLER